MGNSISATELKSVLDGSSPPVVVDVRKEAAFAESGLVLPSAIWVPPQDIREAADGLAGRIVVVYCVHGHEVSQGACASLRGQGVEALCLAGGFEGWRDAGFPVEPFATGEAQ